MHWYFLISSIILPLVSTCLLYALLFPYIFLLFDCFKWALIDRIEKCRGHSVLWQFQIGGPSLISSYYLTVLNGNSLATLKSVEVTPALWQFQMGGSITYIFLLFDCFKWVLIDHIEKCRGHSVLWQFQMGGSITYIFLLFDCFKWVLIDHIEKCRGHSVLWQFRMGGSNGRFTLNLPILSSLAVSCFASQKVFSYYIRKT